MDTQSTGKACLAPKRTIAYQLLDGFQEAVERAERLADRVCSTLEPVATEDCPSPCCEGSNEMEYPPLFSEYRVALRRLNESMDVIENVIDRTEV